MKTNTKIGLALGGGGAKGWCHIGIINALAAKGIRPSVVAGTSIGALVGAAYASGGLSRLEKWVTPMSRADVMSYLDISLRGGGLIHGEKLIEAIAKETFKDMQIEELSMPFGAVATKLRTGQEHWFRDGSLHEAVRASLALPGLFTPVNYEGVWFIDGGLVNPVPVSLCRALGAEVIIAVNLNNDGVPPSVEVTQLLDSVDKKEPKETLWGNLSQPLSLIEKGKGALIAKTTGGKSEIPSYYEVFSNSISIMQNCITRSRLAGDPPDVTLTPSLRDIGTIDFHKSEQAIEAGERCVYRMMPVLDDLFS